MDIFRRPDGTFGFAVFRREVEAEERWAPLGLTSHRVFNTEEAAYGDARASETWLK